MPLPFHNDYLTTTNPSLTNASSHLVKAISCLTSASSTGTHLAAPMKAAARYILGKDTNNLAALPTRTGTPRKVIIFETDGQPNEDIRGRQHEPREQQLPGCEQRKHGLHQPGQRRHQRQVAERPDHHRRLQPRQRQVQRKLRVRPLPRCSLRPRRPTRPARASDADNPCATSTERAVENGDGDFFFCAASGDDMSDVFVTAIGSAGGGIRLIRLP